MNKIQKNPKIPETYSDELIDLVNDQDQVISVIKRSNIPDYAQQGYTRVVLAFVINHENKIAILRRTADRLYSPLHLAIVGGGVQSGEDYDQAAKREIAEEVGINIEQYPFTCLGYLRPQEGWHDSRGHAFFKKIYQVTLDHSQIQFDQNEFCQLFWLTPQEVLAKTKTDKVAHGLEWLLKNYY